MARAKAAEALVASEAVKAPIKAQSGQIVVRGGHFLCKNDANGIWWIRDVVGVKGGDAWKGHRASDMKMAFEAAKVAYTWKWIIK